MLKLFCVVTLISSVLSYEENLSDEIDPVLYYLLNGEYEGAVPSSEAESESALNGGIWKCGRCEDLEQSKLIYSEENAGVDVTDQSLDVQITVTLQDMTCVIVRGSISGIVKNITGNCEGPSVTLSVLPAYQFVLNVYGK